jgi:molybdopterin-synthase adenylyltransferase
MSTRYDRQIRLFGQEGQRRLAAAHVVLLGLGGLGMHLVQQLSYLGVRWFTVADSDDVDETNLNRLVGATPDDIGLSKVAIAERMIRAVQTDADVTALPVNLPDRDIAAAIANATVVIGCFDKETPRLTATDLCSAAGVPYVDIATEVILTETGAVFGGRVVVADDGTGCVSCLDVLDAAELARERMTDEQRRVHDEIYGIDRGALGGSGPSVVTLNGVVASLAAMEVMCMVTGLRAPARQLEYRGDLGTVLRSRAVGQALCPFCLRWHEAARRR